MYKLSLIVGLALALLLSPLRFAAAGRDPGFDRAVALKDRGNQLMHEHRFEEALAAFDDAYVLNPTAELFVSIGSAHRLLDRPALAANYYQRYLNAGDRDTSKRSEVEAALRELDLQLGRVEVTVVGTGDLRMRIGDEALPPMRILRVSPGRFEIGVRLGAGGEQIETGTVGAGQTVTIAFTFATAPRVVEGSNAAAGSVAQSANVEIVRARHRGLVYGLGGTAAALALAGAYLAVRASHEQELADTLCSERLQCPGTAVRAAAHNRRAVSYSQLAAGTFIGAAVAAAAATVVWWRDRPSTKQVGVAAGRDGASIVYAGSF